MACGRCVSCPYSPCWWSCAAQCDHGPSRRASPRTRQANRYPSRVPVRKAQPPFISGSPTTPVKHGHWPVYFGKPGASPPSHVPGVDPVGVVGLDHLAASPSPARSAASGAVKNGKPSWRRGNPAATAPLPTFQAFS